MESLEMKLNKYCEELWEIEENIQGIEDEISRLKEELKEEIKKARQLDKKIADIEDTLEEY